MQDWTYEELEEILGKIEHPEERHCLLVVLADNSQAMCGKPMEEINEALRCLFELVSNDTHLSGKLDSYLIPLNRPRGFVPHRVQAENIPRLEASGSANLNAGILSAVDTIALRKKQYQSLGIDYNKPQIVLLLGSTLEGEELADEARQTLSKNVAERQLGFCAFPYGSNAERLKNSDYNAGVWLSFEEWNEYCDKIMGVWTSSGPPFPTLTKAECSANASDCMTIEL